jgi:hypothetical protein
MIKIKDKISVSKLGNHGRSLGTRQIWAWTDLKLCERIRWGCKIRSGSDMLELIKQDKSPKCRLMVTVISLI